MFRLDYQEPVLVAEIGCNHMGSMDVARELIDLAKLCGVRHVKFQKRTVDERMHLPQYQAPHPEPRHAYGDTYGEHRRFLEFTQDQHAELQAWCLGQGMKWSTSVWDVTAAREMIELAPEWLKVPSACNHDRELLEVLRDRYDGAVHVSLGMTTRAEERRVVELFEAAGAARDRLVLYACTSGYPVPFPDVCLLEIHRLYDLYGDRVAAIGFSGHHLGIAIDVAAYTLGARWLERHFTKDRTWKGTDHAASLEPTGLAKLQRDLKAAHQSLTFKPEEILDLEQAQRRKLKLAAEPAAAHR